MFLAISESMLQNDIHCFLRVDIFYPGYCFQRMRARPNALTHRFHRRCHTHVILGENTVTDS